MAHYWLCVTNEDNWKTVKDKRVWGVSERYRSVIETVRPGDYLVFYVMPKRIMGVFKAVSKPFESRKSVFPWRGASGREIYPYRVRLEPVILAEKPLMFDEIISKLGFIKNKARWSGYLRRAMILIPEGDFDMIMKCLEKASHPKES
mgnify:CR=1 FL=1